MAKLEARHLTISFRTNNGAVRAVRDVSFSLNAGETLAIAGESGSGKSVTSRAIMGILAGNAMVENGEIIYDGRDLLKIPEEEFHTLRGYKLAMVFQDPLSALNPIMRIGKQLTEAMILNNKERRRDGRKNYGSMLGQLEKNMKAAGVNGSEIRRQIGEFRKITDKGMELRETYEAAQEAAVEAADCVDEMRANLLKREEKSVREGFGRMVKACGRVCSEYGIPSGDADFEAALSKAKTAFASFSARDTEGLTAALDELEPVLKRAAEPETVPDFFAIGYGLMHGSSFDPKTSTMASINASAGQQLEKGFMQGFRALVEKACAHSASESARARSAACAVLKEKRAAFERSPLDKKSAYRAGREAADAVDGTIDRLSIEKDSASYVFRSSVKANLDRYFYGVKANPKEEKRFARDSEKHDKLERAGKVALSVVPKNLVDLDAARNNILRSIDELCGRYEGAEKEGTKSCAVQAAQVVEYLQENAAQAAHTITPAVAKHHAIELMQEVGIPEPYKRFYQYPFEFSGGMRQRIVIAIALSANPDILICDEPTTALDVTIQAQILELINRLKVQRKLSVIFITHDLGVVANMADRLAIMYAGKIVEYGTADDVFYDPRHPYTWALLSSMPDLETKEKLEAIPGTPPDMIIPPKGDAFAARNKYAMQIDFEEQPPMFQISETHSAATWLLHPNAPKVEPPKIVLDRIARMKQLQAEHEAEEAELGQKRDAVSTARAGLDAALADIEERGKALEADIERLNAGSPARILEAEEKDRREAERKTFSRTKADRTAALETPAESRAEAGNAFEVSGRGTSEKAHAFEPADASDAADISDTAESIRSFEYKSDKTKKGKGEKKS